MAMTENLSPEEQQRQHDGERRRARCNCFWGWTAGIVAAVSLWAAACNDFAHSWIERDNLGKLIVGIWALGPPVFFWVDWVFLCKYMKPESKERDVAKHTHDLARNIWVGLLAVLAYSFFKAKF
jgi:hypothetical protein